jgi:hypothetical protein
LFHRLADEAIGVHEVRDARHRPGRHLAENLRLAEHTILQRHAVALRSLGLLAHEQPRDVHHPLVPLILRVRALQVTELALPAEVGRAREIVGRELLGARGVVLLDVAIDPREHVRERPAVTHAHAAVVADVEHPPHLALEIARVPVALLVRIERRRLLRNGIQLRHEKKGTPGAVANREERGEPPRRQDARRRRGLESGRVSVSPLSEQSPSLGVLASWRLSRSRVTVGV